MSLPALHIGELTARIPIIQGGMGIGISLSGLAGAVAKEGGIGVISAAQPGFDEPDFRTNTIAANCRALARHLKKARETAPDGIIGVNIMTKGYNYEVYAKCAVENGADIIFSGAGLPADLPACVEGSNTKIAPIIGSPKACRVLLKLWDRHHHTTADLVVIEGPKAGGHLGYTREATKECDAADEFKQMYVKAKKEDVTIVQSPVHMPGRALLNPFVKRIRKQRENVRNCFHCLKTCDPRTTPYCITMALIRAVKGDVDNALVFCGANAYKIKDIVSVHDLMCELST